MRQKKGGGKTTDDDLLLHFLFSYSSSDFLIRTSFRRHCTPHAPFSFRRTRQLQRTLESSPRRGRELGANLAV